MKKTPVWQIILLVALLGVLIYAMFRAFSGINPPRRAAQQADAGAAPAAQQEDGTTATDMPDVVPTSSRGRLGENVSAASKAGHINPNLFKVYQVEPPKNPFVKREEWYAEAMERIPGYPELAESDYFDNMDAYLPDIGFIYDNPEEWDSVSIQRSQDNKYNISGVSEDGSVQTQISLEKDVPTSNAYTWHKGSRVPLANLQNSDWVMDQIRQGKPQALEIEEDEPLFDENGLPVPGTGGINGMETTSGSGDTFACYGVSVKGAKSSALLMYNGAPRIVTEGMVLPTHYEVLQINRDGVVLVDLKSGFSIHVPLGGQTDASTAQQT